MLSKWKAVVAIVILPLVVLASLGIFLTLLNQPSFGEKVVRYALDFVQDENFKVNYQEGEFSLFHGFKFLNVELSLNQPEVSETHLSIAEVSGRYHLWDLLQGHLNLESVRVVQPKIDVTVLSSPSQDEEGADSAESDGALPGWLTRLSLQSFLLQNLQLKFINQSLEPNQSILVDDLNISSHLIFDFTDLSKNEESFVRAEVGGVKVDEREFKNIKFEVLSMLQKAGELSLKTQAWLGNLSVIDVAANANYQENLRGEFEGQIFLTHKILDLADLKNLGDVTIGLSGKTQFERTAQDLLQIRKFQRWPFLANLKIRIQQSGLKNPLKALVRFEPLEMDSQYQQTVSLDKNITLKLVGGKVDVPESLKFQSADIGFDGKMGPEDWTISGKLGLNDLKTPAFKKPVSPQIETKVSGDLQFHQINLSADLSDKANTLVSFVLSLQDRQGELQLRPDIKLSLSPRWDFLLDKETFQGFGQLDGTLSGEIKLLHGQSSWMQWQDTALEKTPVSVALNGQVAQPEKYAQKTQLGLPAAVTYKIEGQLRPHDDEINGLLSFEAPRLGVKETATLSGLKVSSLFRGTKAGAGHVKFNLGLNDLTIEKELRQELNEDISLGAMQIEVLADLFSPSRFEITKFEGFFAEKLLKLQVQGKGDLDLGDINMSGALLVNTRGRFSAFTGLNVDGDISFPWSVVMRNRHTVEFDGKLQFSQLSVRLGNNYVEGISGALVVKETLVQRKGSWQLDRILNRNPFERVDFHRFQPFLAETDPLLIKKIGFEGLELGPLSGFFSLRQNLLTAQKFYFKAGSGEVAGEIFSDFYPGQRAFGALVRLSGLRPNEVLPQKLLGQQAATSQPVSGRVGLVYQLSQGTVDGRLDITEIGREQVLTMVDVLDPNLENENLNLARKGLAFGFPTGMYLGIKQGILDLDLRLGGVAGSLGQIRAPSIPVSGVVSSMSSEIENVFE